MHSFRYLFHLLYKIICYRIFFLNQINRVACFVSACKCDDGWDHWFGDIGSSNSIEVFDNKCCISLDDNEVKAREVHEK